MAAAAVEDEDGAVGWVGGWGAMAASTAPWMSANADMSAKCSVDTVGADGSGSPLVAGTNDVISKPAESAADGEEEEAEGEESGGAEGKDEAKAGVGPEREEADTDGRLGRDSSATACSARQRSISGWRCVVRSKDWECGGFSVCMMRSMTSNGKLGNISARKRNVESSDMSTKDDKSDEAADM